MTRPNLPALLAVLSSACLPLGVEAQAAPSAQALPSTQAHLEEAVSPAGLGDGLYETMTALMEVTILNIDVLTLTVRVDPRTGRRLRALVAGHDYDEELADSITRVILESDDLWARQVLHRDVGYGRLLGGMRETSQKAVDDGFVSQAYFDRFSAQLPDLFGFLEEEGSEEGDEIFFRVKGDSVRTVYRDVTGLVRLDQTAVDREGRRASIPSFFARGTRFRKRLVESLIEDQALLVPHFEGDDPVVGTAGFVARTARVSQEVAGTTFTLMTFAVGDVLTLGAMVDGDFEGTAEWVVDDRTFSVPLRRTNRGRADVEVQGQPLLGQHGGFNAFDWVNVEVPRDEWLDDETRIRLTFLAADGEYVLPAPGEWFVASLREEGR